ncbi:MAG: universal stress protein [Anaerolineae bacterium]|jgi:nucleotide-binding universal stress UspA family protein
MGKILCATRGGEASHRTQDAAIALAKERGDELIFLYVVDLHFLDKTAGASVVDMENEITKMGEFLLLMAKERAAERSVTARTLSRHGRVREELKSAAVEEGASLIVLGRPTGTESIFELTDLRQCAAEVEAETGVETIIV